ncbi:hypothetical protein LguiB_022187 [Lonicera macranthoides]
MKPMETLYDLIEEAKLRTLWWALCIFTASYFLTHTSKSMWMNVPIAILLVSGLRILFNEVEINWKVRTVRRQTYLSHLEKKQLSANDSLISTSLPPAKWKRKIGSPVVEAAMEDFVNKILQDFIVDLWYSEITSDKEAPELIRAIIMDALGEVSGRVKEINLVDLLTRDVVDLIGDHFELYRSNQAAIGADVMGTLSFEERDERLKHHLMASKELHPALISPECEHKVLQWIMGGVLAIVLRPQEAQCPLVRCIAREILTCLVMQPIMNFASPVYINELIEYILEFIKEEFNWGGDGQSPNVNDHNHDHAVAAEHLKTDEAVSEQIAPIYDRGNDIKLARFDNQGDLSFDALGKPLSNTTYYEDTQPHADWARVLEAATQRRTQVLTPENLENMWCKGRHYKEKLQDNKMVHLEQAPSKEPYFDQVCSDKYEDITSSVTDGNKSRFKRSSSTSDLKAQPIMGRVFTRESAGPNISEFCTDIGRHGELKSVKSTSDTMLCSEGQQFSKLKCRVKGAYFEKLGSKSFAVYSIAVTDADQNTWFVKRRYSNFERLHRQLKDIPNYTLHLPPKRIFSSSTEDALVHQRCIQLNKYLQDLLSIANVAEQHEVWDFLSVSSKKYSFGRSSSVMKTLAVNVDDAVDDIVRQFKGVSDGLMRKVVGSSPLSSESASLVSGRNLDWKTDELHKLLRQNTSESANSNTDNEEGDKDGATGYKDIGSCSGWHSDNELNSKGFPPRVVKREKDGSRMRFRSLSLGRDPVVVNPPVTSDHLEDPIGAPPEWTPPNVTVPVLNLVDKIFQLNRRGWLRRQVFWISKQILQLMMEDAIDDFLLRQIHWLRREDIIAQGIRWLQDVLWPDGKFFLKFDIQSKLDDSKTNQRSSQTTSNVAGIRVSNPGSFEQQLEAARRASDIKKMIFNGAPTALVGFIGKKQYKRCAKDLYYFLQSTICLKQLAYGILELILVSIFPELREIVLEVHEKMRAQPA